MKKNLYPTIQEIKTILRNSLDSSPKKAAVYFKTGPGEYAQFDKFLGIKTPTLRAIAKEYSALPISSIENILHSTFNEERLLALIMLVSQYKRGNESKREAVYQSYLTNIKHVNNWNLVDNSAHYILGAHLWNKNRSLLTDFAQSKDLWERRISIVATWYYIKQQNFDDTIKIVSMLLNDKEDLIHKACGWMLREVGKQNTSVLTSFLEENCSRMPRTMLRYAIERLSEDERSRYLSR